MQPKEIKIKNENGSAFLRATCSLLAEAPFPLYSLSCILFGGWEGKGPLPWVEMNCVEHAPRLLSDRNVK